MTTDTQLTELIINTLSPEQMPEQLSDTEIYLVEDDAEYATVEELATKQDKLSFIITEDMFDLEYDDTKGVAPYSTSYGYTNVTIHEDTGVEWVEGASYTFVLDTKVSTSANRNVRVRIGESGDWKPLFLETQIANGATFFVKARSISYIYKSTYQENGALHCSYYDTNTTYTLHTLIDSGSHIAGAGTYAVTRYSLCLQKPNMTWEKVTATNATYSTGTTKKVNTNGFLLNRINYYSYTTNYANGAKIGANYMCSQINSITGSYSFNCGTAPNWAVGDYIYLVGTIGSDGLFYLDTTKWWDNKLPTTNDGKLYIQLGIALTTTDSTMSFYANRPIYYHDGTEIKQYQGTKINNPNSLFDCKFADHLLNNASWLRADTFEWNSGDVYVDAYNLLVEEYATGTEETEDGITFKRTSNGFKIALATQETAILSKYNTDGIAWFYILDTENKRFKLPRTKWGFKGLRDVVGNPIDEKLPNIKGYWNNASTSSSTGGAIYLSQGSYGNYTSGTGTANSNQRNFDASRSSSTYQDGAPVQERGTQMYLYFYVGETVQNANLIDAGRIAEQLASKQDSCIHIINTYENGSSGYIVWSNGYCEQWGISSTNFPASVSTTENVHLLKRYNSTSYIVTVNKITTTTSATYGVTYNILGDDNFNLNTNNSAAGKISWSTKGYLAEGEY